MPAAAAWNEFTPPNSFRWRWTRWGDRPALAVLRRNDKSADFVFPVLDMDAIAIENVRKKCVEMDENVRRNGALV